MSVLAFFVCALVAICAPSCLAANADLTALSVNAGALSPSFTAGTTDYTVVAAPGTTTFTVTATKFDAGGTAAATVNGTGPTTLPQGTASAPFSLGVGTNSLSILVTASDSSTKTYTVSIIRSPSVSIAVSAAAKEGGAVGSFTFTIQGNAISAIPVSYSVSGTTAAVDYLPALTSTITIPIGSSTATQAITPVDDTATEADETLKLTVVAGSYPYVIDGVNFEASLVIEDNELPGMKIIATDATSNEGGDTGTFTVTRFGNKAPAVTVTYTRSGTASTTTPPIDVQPLSGSVVIGAGVTTATIVVTPVNSDTTPEADETVILSLGTSPNYSIISGLGTATVNVQDDDLNSVTIGATDPAATETLSTAPANPGSFTVTRVGNITTNLTLSYIIAGSAVNGTDYVTISATVIIPAGSTTAKINITPLDDTDGENDETVQITLAASASYTLGATISGTVTIQDNDTPFVTISATDAFATEDGADTGKFSISRIGNTLQALTVTLSVGGTATPGTNYTALPSQVVIGAGQTSATLTVTGKDAAAPIDNTVIVTLSASGSGAYILQAPSNATVTVIQKPVLSIAVFTDATEGNPPGSGGGGSNGVFRITRTGSAPFPVALTCNYSVSTTASTAAPADYALTPSATTIVIPAGSASADITVSPQGDTIGEDIETLTVSITANAKYNIEPLQGSRTMNITDDDNNYPTVSIEATTLQAEEPNSATSKPAVLGIFTVTRHTSEVSPATALTVNIGASGTATPTDYEALAGTVVIPAGSKTATITITPKEDTATEANETVIVTVQPNAAYKVATTPGDKATVSILDGDSSTVTVTATPTTMTEAATLALSGKFSFKRVGNTSLPLTVKYTVSTGANQALQGENYQLVVGVTVLTDTVVIPSGTDTAVVTVSALQDTQANNDRQVKLTIDSGQAGYNPGSPSTATVTITDDDPPEVTIVASIDTAVEPSTNGQFRVSRLGSTVKAVTVSFSATGLATPGTDYTALTGSVVMPAGQAFAIIVVTPKDDTPADDNETVIATLTGAGANYSIGTPNNATITIRDKPTVNVTATVASAHEGTAPTPPFAIGSFTIDRGTITTGKLTVQYVISTSSTASSGLDFTALSGTAILQDGSTSITITVTPVNNAVGENDETVVMLLKDPTTNPAPYKVGTNNTATVTIVDDDPPGIVVTVSTPTINEGGSGSFTVSRVGQAPASTITVKYSVAGNALKGTDYTPITQVLTFDNAGPSSKSVTFDALVDSTSESDETIIFSILGGSGYTVGSPSSATSIIKDQNQATVSIVATDATASEPGTTNPGVFTFSRVGNTALPLSVSFVISGSSTAVAGTDYIALAASPVVIPAGKTSATITVTAIDNTSPDFDRMLTLAATPNPGSGPTFYVVSATQKQATVTIQDNEAPVVSLQATDTEASETGPDVAKLTVVRKGSKATSLAVAFTLGGTAVNANDFTSLGGTITLPAGQGSVAIVITPKNDTLDTEGDETVVVTLTAGTGYTLQDPIATQCTATATIHDKTVVSITSTGNGTEPSTNGKFTISRSGGTTAAGLTIGFAVSGNSTATINKDFQFLNNNTTTSIVIPAGQSSVDLGVKVLDDTTGENDETVNVTLTTTATTPYVVNSVSSAATVTIADDGDQNSVVIAATDDAAGEGSSPFGNGTFLVTRTGSAAAGLTVNFTIAGNATPNADYVALSGSVVFAIGSKTATITVTPIDDSTLENDETVVVALASSPNYTKGAAASATVNLFDNETPTVTVIASDAVAGESSTGSNPGIFTITRTGTKGTPLTVQYSISASSTAVFGTDYTLSPSTGAVVIPIGAASGTVSVLPLNDTTPEDNKTVILKLTADAAYSFSTPTAPAATVTIQDDDPAIVSVSKESDAVEPNVPGKFTVKRTGNNSATIIVNYTIAGTAVPTILNGVPQTNPDYVALNGTVTITGGTSTGTILVTPVDDTDATIENVSVTIKAGTGYAPSSVPSAITANLDIQERPMVTVASTGSAKEGTITPTDTRIIGEFTFTRTGPTGGNLTVLYAIDTDNSTGTAGSDFTTLTGTVIIPAGSATVKVLVTPLDDLVGEDDEVVVVSVSPPTGTPTYVAGGSSATVTIADNDDNNPAVEIDRKSSNADASEPSGVGGFTVTRRGSTAAKAGVLTVLYQVVAVAGGATAGTDYTTLSGTVVIAATQSTANINVTVVDDTATENNEKITLNLAPGTGYTLGNPAHRSADVFIFDDESSTVKIVANDATAAESTGIPNQGQFTVSRDGNRTGSLTVSFTISGASTATFSADYSLVGSGLTANASGGTIVMPPNAASVTFSVNVVADTTAEVDETLKIDAVDGGALYSLNNAAKTATVTIQDNNKPQIGIVATNSLATEGGTSGVFTLSRVGSGSKVLTVDLAITGTATNGSDYNALTTPVFIPAGKDFLVITIAPKPDAEAESDETVILTINTSAAYDINGGGQNTGTVSIKDRPTLTAAPSTASFGEGTNATFTITRSAGSVGSALTVKYSVTGSASSGSDYSVLTGQVVIAPAATTATVTITTVDDTLGENDETVIFNFNDIGAYNIATFNSTMTITDTDNPTVTIAAVNDTVEGQPAGSVRVSRAVGNATPALTVTFTVGGTATAVDYNAASVSTSVVIPAGQKTVDVLVTASLDAIAENNETVSIVLSVPGTPIYSIGLQKSATVTIVDANTPDVLVSATGATATEPTSNGAFTITRIGDRREALSVTYSIGGTATAGTDYSTLSGTATIPSGSSTVAVTVTPIDDQASENAETIVLTLTGAGATYNTISPSNATVNLLDNEANEVSISTSVATAVENNILGSFTVTRVGNITKALTVNYSIAGTAANGSDYENLVGTVVIAINKTTATITVTPKNDTDSGNETVILTVVAGTGYIPGSNTTATVTIQDNNAPNLGSNPTFTGTPTASGAPINIVGTATDPDGPNALTYTWSVTSGAGAVTFGNANNATTTAAFSTSGTYILKITVTDGAKTSTGEMTITVAP